MWFRDLTVPVLVLKVAVTDVADAAVMLHVPVPLQAPDHPAKVEPVLGVSVSVMDVPAAKLALHVWPQLIPEGALLTVPDPEPESTTLTCTLPGFCMCEEPQPETATTSVARQYSLTATFVFGISYQALSK